MANSAFGKHTDKPQSVYNVTFGKASKRLTVFCGFVFAAVTVLCVVTSPGGIANFIAPVVLLLCTIVCYGYFPRRIEVAAEALTVRRGIGSRKIPLSTIVSVERYDGMKTDIRIFGKPTARINRRMGVVVGYEPHGSDLDALRTRVKAAAERVKVTE